MPAAAAVIDAMGGSYDFDLQDGGALVEKEFGPMQGRPSSAVVASMPKVPVWIKARPQSLNFGRRPLCIASVKTVEIRPTLAAEPGNPGKRGADGISIVDRTGPVRLLQAWSDSPAIFPSIQ